MVYAQLQQKLEESKLEIQRLRERMSIGTQTVHKDLSLISLSPRWSGSDSTNSLEEFISTPEASARIRRWEPKDTVEIAALKLEDQLEYFITDAQNSTRETHRGILLKRYSGNGTRTSIRTSSITRGYRWPGKAKMKARRNSQTDVER